MAIDAGPRTAYQPLHASMRDKLDPEYVTLHDEVLQYILPIEAAAPWSPEDSRTTVSPLAFGGQKLVRVASVVDKDVGAGVQIRIFTPEGSPSSSSSEGWPCLVWLHGGGWVNGGLNSENGFLRHVCKYLRCVVCTINYRHAPEYVYPTAVEDSYRGFEWIIRPENVQNLMIDTKKIIFGGLSAGGNLTAVLSLKVGQSRLPARPMFQFLICPVFDNTADTTTAWSTSKHSPWLTPARMTWYREQYFGSNRAAATNEWTASPCAASAELLAQCPETFIAVAECDLLAPEGVRYAEKLDGVGVPTEIKIYKGATHSILVLAGAHRIGKELVHDTCERLAARLGILYDRTAAPVERQ